MMEQAHLLPAPQLNKFHVAACGEVKRTVKLHSSNHRETERSAEHFHLRVQMNWDHKCFPLASQKFTSRILNFIMLEELSISIEISGTESQ